MDMNRGDSGARLCVIANGDDLLIVTFVLAR